MKKQITILSVITLFAFLSNSPVKAFTDLMLAGSTPYNIALGNTGVYGSSGIESIFENPAYIDTSHNISAGFMTSKLPDEANLYMGGVRVNFEQGWTWGAAFARTAVDEINHTGLDVNDNPVILDTFSYSQLKFKNVLAKAINRNLQVGLGVSLESLQAGSLASGSGLLCDLGLVYIIDENIQLGLRSDIFGEYYLFNIPFGAIKFKGGDTEVIPNKVNAGLNIKAMPDLNVMIAASHIRKQDINISLGANYLAAKQLEIRAGISQERISKGERAYSLSLGLGVLLDIFRLDYAFKNHPEFNDMNLHAFSMGVLY